MRETEMKRHLVSQNYHTKKEWLKSCMAYLKSTVRVVDSNKLVDLVIEQFINSDISDSYEVQMRIPKNAVKLMLTRRMIFQVVSFVDVSTSIYEQLSDATKDDNDLSWFHGEDVGENENEHETIGEARKKKRGMIKVELSDGVNNVHAIEISEPLFDLNSITPGMKIILTDKVRCRKGTLLLTTSNCQILGGQVEKLNYIPVEKMAKMLNIDLDAERIRKRLVNEKAAEVRRLKKEKQCRTQSTLSPFLVKTSRINKKTDETNNVADFQQMPTSEDVIFTPLPADKRPTIPRISAEREPTNIRMEPVETDQDNLEFNVFAKKSVQKNRPIDEFSRPSHTEKLQESTLPKLRNNQIYLVNDHSKQHGDSNKSSNVIGTSRQAEILRKDVDAKFSSAADLNLFQNSKTKVLTRQLLEEAAPHEKVSEPEVEIYEPGKLANYVKKENYDEVMLHSSLTIPVVLKKSLNTNNKPDDEFSRNIHGPRNPSRKRKSSPNRVDINEVFNKMRHLKKSEREQNQIQMEVVAPKRRHQEHYDEHVVISDDEEGVETEFINNTMEADGLNECRRWKIGYETPSQYQQDILPTWNPNINTYRVSLLRTDNKQEMEKVLKIEPPGGMKYININKNKKSSQQSANVQIYGTPLVKRIPSAEHSSFFSAELYKRMSNLNIVPLHDALATRKFWLKPKNVAVMPTYCQQIQKLQSDGVGWCLEMKVSDTSEKEVVCTISSALLDKIFGFTVSECIGLSCDGIRAKKIEAEKKLSGFNRLDLIIWLEVSPDIDEIPKIIDVKTISDALNVL